MEYKCLRCGSRNGEPIDNSSENWYWRVVENGRVGPFCSQTCSREFRLTDESGFSLTEWERLRFLKWRVTNGELAEDSTQIAS
jgi:DNA-directed RNA polymerase subunit RPC12/RpoP